MARAWQTIDEGGLYKGSPRFRYRKWSALDAVDRAETIAGEFGEEILDAVRSSLNQRRLRAIAANGDGDDATLAASLSNEDLLVQSLYGIVERLSGKTVRRYTVDYFLAAEMETLADGVWVRLVAPAKPNADGTTPEVPDMSGLDDSDLDANAVLRLMWRLLEVNFGPLFAGLTSKAGAKGASLSDATSPPAATA